MALSLDHTIVPARDKEESVRFIAKILGLEYKGPWGHFAPLKINDTLTLDFDNNEKFEGHHYALLASDEEFDAILKRVREEGVSYGSGPGSQDDGKINHLHQGRGEASTSEMQTGMSGKSLPTLILLTPTNSSFYTKTAAVRSRQATKG